MEEVLVDLVALVAVVVPEVLVVGVALGVQVEEEPAYLLGELEDQVV